MRPTSRELIESIRWALDAKVAPQLDDRWAASTLRSVGLLLDHLAVRVEIDHEIAMETRDDLHTTFSELRVLLAEGATGHWTSLLGELSASLDAPKPSCSGAPAALDDQISELQDLCDRMLRALRTDPDGVPEANAEEIHARLKAHLKRQLERERPLFVPAFMGDLF